MFTFLHKNGDTVPGYLSFFVVNNQPEVRAKLLSKNNIMVSNGSLIDVGLYGYGSGIAKVWKLTLEFN